MLRRKATYTLLESRGKRSETQIQYFEVKDRHLISKMKMQLRCQTNQQQLGHARDHAWFCAMRCNKGSQTG